jgi:glycosyltransferase involved in cell wall biosynthesis
VNRPLRFCMITTFYPPYNFGGDGIFVYRLSNELAKQGHHVEVVHCQDAYLLLADKPPSPAPQHHPNVVVHGLKSPFGFLSPLATQQTGYPIFKASRLRKILKAGFDVINYHNVSLVGGPGVLQYGDAIKLYTLHEFWLVCPTHVLFKNNRSACERPACFACNLVYRRPPPLWRYTSLMKSAVRHVDAFISPDRHTISKHREFGLDLPMVHLPHFVPAGEETSVENRREYEDLRGKPYFLFVGRLERIKGLQTLIPLFRRWSGARLLIAGTGGYGDDLRRAAEGCDNIQFLGYQSGDRLDALYRNAVALVVPSINYEVAPPLVIMEAFLRRTPAIVRGLGSMPESIEDSGGGFVYRSDEDLLESMRRLLDDTILRDELGARGHTAYQTQWTTDAYLERYLGLIGRLAQAKRTGRTA